MALAHPLLQFIVPYSLRALSRAMIACLCKFIFIVQVGGEDAVPQTTEGADGVGSESLSVGPVGPHIEGSHAGNQQRAAEGDTVSLRRAVNSRCALRCENHRCELRCENHRCALRSEHGSVTWSYCCSLDSITLCSSTIQFTAWASRLNFSQLAWRNGAFRSVNASESTMDLTLYA